MSSSLNVQLTDALRKYVDERASDKDVYATPSEYTATCQNRAEKITKVIVLQSTARQKPSGRSSMTLVIRKNSVTHRKTGRREEVFVMQCALVRHEVDQSL